MNTNGTLTCLECGKPVGPSMRYDKVFCCTACGTRWNNRRKNRGAEIYDLFMAMRFDRKNAKGVWAIMCRMASNWNEEDKAAGRKSFVPVRKAVQRSLPHVGIRGRATRTSR